MPLNSQWPRIRECSTSSCHLFFRELDAFYSLFDELYFYVSIQWTSINRSQASAFLATPIDDGELHERKSNGTGSNHLRKSVVCMGSGRSLVTNRYPPYHVLLTAHALIFNFSRPSKLLWKVLEQASSDFCSQDRQSNPDSRSNRTIRVHRSADNSPNPQMTKIEVLILGAGWTSNFLIPLCEKEGVSYTATSRSGRDGTVPFEFKSYSEDPEPYEKLPEAQTVLITFPIKDKGGSERLVRLYKCTHGGDEVDVRFIQLGTTGIWGVSSRFHLTLIVKLL